VPIETRLALHTDIHFLRELIALSVRGLSKEYYTERQIESAIRHIFGVDTQLINDETYYLAESDSKIIACGGWSKRNTLFGGDQHKDVSDSLLNPATDAARIRAFFVHPDWARKGIGRRMISLCENAAIENGFTAIELGATLPGVPLYAAMGYVSMAEIPVEMPDGVVLPVVRMGKKLRYF
jgi:GNAT superfamily N-acetyltransferase